MDNDKVVYLTQEGLNRLQAELEVLRNKRRAEVAERIRQAALAENVLTYPTQGCVDGVRGDHILLAPPFIVKEEECRTIARAIEASLNTVFGF